MILIILYYETVIYIPKRRFYGDFRYLERTDGRR